MLRPIMSTRPLLPWLAFSACALIWGSTFLFIAIGNDALPPVWGATLRLALASAILFAIARWRRQPLPTGPALRAAVIYGTLMFGINFPLLYWGELSVPSGVTAVVFATLPLTTPLMARALGIERLHALKLLGGVIAFAGVAVIFWRQIAASVSVWPMAAVLVAATVAGLGTILLKKGPRQAPIPANAVASLTGCIVCFVISLAIHEPHPMPTTVAQIVPVLYLAVLGSVGAFTLLAWLVNHWDPTNISFISVVNPVVAVTLGLLVRNEQIGTALLFGALLVLAGVVLAALSDRMRARAQHA
jgi:drug/metabolite transporter (DMT)-like permease